MRNAGQVLLICFTAMILALWPAAQSLDHPPMVDWGPDGKLLIASDGLLARFDLEAGTEELVDRFSGAFALHPRGASVALARGRVIEIRSYPGLREETQVWPLEGTQVTALSWSPDGGSLAAGTEQGRVLLWAIGPGTLQAEFAAPARRPVAKLRFSSDGSRLLVIFSGGEATLWDIGTSRRLHYFAATGATGKESGAGQVAEVAVQDLHPSGRRVLVTQVEADRSSLILTDDQGMEIWRRPGYGMEFTRDGAGILALSWPFRVAGHYRTSDGRAVQTYEPPPEIRLLYLLRQSPDGARLLAVGEDNRTQALLLWDFETARLLAVQR